MSDTAQIAQLISTYSAGHQTLLDFSNSLDTRVLAAEAKFDAWRQDRDVIGTHDAHGTWRYSIFQGLLYSTGGVEGLGAIGYQDFASGDIEAGRSNDIYLHFRTPMNVAATGGMFHFHIRGYAYGAVTILDEHFVGFCYPAGLIQTNFSGNMNPHAYRGSDDSIYLRVFFPTTYQVTLCIDTQKVGSAGISFPSGSLHAIASTEAEL